MSGEKPRAKIRNPCKTPVLSKSCPPRPGIEPGPSTWQAEILTTRLSRICWWGRWNRRENFPPLPKKHASKMLPRTGFEPVTYGLLLYSQLQSTALPTELSRVDALRSSSSWLCPAPHHQNLTFTWFNHKAELLVQDERHGRMWVRLTKTLRYLIFLNHNHHW